MLKIIMDRNGKKIELLPRNEKDAGNICEREGYKKLNPLNIDNYNNIQWEGIEFNRLYIKNGFLYRFNWWLGEYPYKGIELEQIGHYTEV